MRTELVTTLKRQATEILNQLEKDREPILITQHGVPSAYLVDVETFETLQRRMTLLEGIARGEKAIEEGRSLTHKQVWNSSPVPLSAIQDSRSGPKLLGTASYQSPQLKLCLQFF